MSIIPHLVQYRLFCFSNHQIYLRTLFIIAIVIWLYGNDAESRRPSMPPCERCAQRFACGFSSPLNISEFHLRDTRRVLLSQFVFWCCVCKTIDVRFSFVRPLERNSPERQHRKMSRKSKSTVTRSASTFNWRFYCSLKLVGSISASMGRSHISDDRAICTQSTDANSFGTKFACRHRRRPSTFIIIIY